MKKATLFLVILLTTCVFLCVPPLCAQENFTSAQVRDISGRAYEPALIELLDGAAESIVISMYNISLGTRNRNSIRLLLNDLHEARARNVSVTLINDALRELREFEDSR